MKNSLDYYILQIVRDAHVHFSAKRPDGLPTRPGSSSIEEMELVDRIPIDYRGFPCILTSKDR